MTAARRETPQRCEGRYPVPQARDEPFEVTYRCALSVGHLGPHRSEPITDGADDRLGPIGIYERALRSIAANSCCTSCREAALVAEAALREAEPPQECGNFTPLKDGLRAPSIADHYGHGWRAGRNAQMSAGENARGGEALGRVPPAAPSVADAAEMLWVVLANVSGGDWTKQTPEWQEAAARWRDYYFAAVEGVASARQESETP
jgi:hypothetical protein